jgi:fatty acid-binding protein DegV
MKQPETKFKEHVQKDLKLVPKCWFFKTQLVALIGIPDIIGCKDGRFFALELKRSRKAAIAKIQEYILARIRDAGGYGVIAYPENWNAIYEEIKAL